MAFRVSTALNNDMVNTMLGKLAAVAGSAGKGRLRIYTGSQPENPDTSPSGTLLVEISDICWSAIFTGVESHAANIDVDNTGKGVITADAGTPYAAIPVGSRIVLTGTSDNDGTYEVESIGGGGASITCTGVIAGTDSDPDTLVISPVKVGISTLVAAAGYSGTAIASGVAGWARLEDSTGDNTLIVDGDVGADYWNVFTINSVAIVTDDVITLLNADIFLL